jgi:hypothetical protein
MPKLFTETLSQTPSLSMPRETGRLPGKGEPLPNHFYWKNRARSSAIQEPLHINNLLEPSTINSIYSFGFSTFLPRDASSPPPTEYWNYDHELHSYCQRDLDYQAPEYILDQKLDPSNDMFGIGCLAYSVLNKGSPFIHSRGNMNTYRQQIDRISQHQFDKLPAHLAGIDQKNYVGYDRSNYVYQNSHHSY